MFALHAQRSLSQIRRANGCLTLALLRDSPRVFWTMTVWSDAGAMRAYMMSGAHGEAMPRLADLADEASMVHWCQDGPLPPSWEEAAQRLKRDGRPARLRHPSRQHANLDIALPRTSVDTCYEEFSPGRAKRRSHAGFCAWCRALIARLRAGDASRGAGSTRPARE